MVLADLVATYKTIFQSFVAETDWVRLWSIEINYSTTWLTVFLFFRFTLANDISALIYSWQKLFDRKTVQQVFNEETSAKWNVSTKFNADQPNAMEKAFFLTVENRKPNQRKKYGLIQK